MKQELSELATVLNEFKSEAVQLRILDFVFGKEPPAVNADQLDESRPARTVQPRTQGKKVPAGMVPEKRKRTSSGSGANATLDQLLPGDFFNKPRTINDIIAHCKHDLARTFKANEFSGKLGRMVRDKELTRKKNADKQYEYQKP